MTDLTILTSLYRAESFLPVYAERLLTTCTEVMAAGVTVEALLIANDPTEAERALLDALKSRAPFPVGVHAVPRETLYASWNRGVAMAAGRAVAVWNVDDARSAAALIEGARRIGAGACRLIDFASIYDAGGRRRHFPPVHHADDPLVSPIIRHRLGPFFMFERALYDEVGPFDPRFRIVGDLEWQARAAAVAPVCRGEAPGGVFYDHGDNLSARADYFMAEDNVIHLLNGAYSGLRLVDPDVMQAVWARWAPAEIPPEIAESLWGARARAIWRRKERMARWLGPLRGPVRRALARSGLRALLVRLGIVQAIPGDGSAE